MLPDAPPPCRGAPAAAPAAWPRAAAPGQAPARPPGGAPRGAARALGPPPAGAAVLAAGAAAATASGAAPRRPPKGGLARGRRKPRVAAGAAGGRPYDVVPNDGCAYGGTVCGYDVRAAIGDAEATEQLRADLSEHRLLVFRGQGELTAEDHVALSEQLGSIDHGVFRSHAKTPDSRLLRLANDEAEGFVPGISDWHVGGSMLQAPFSIQAMHFLRAIPGEQGETAFLGLSELASQLDPELLDEWRRLWFVSGFGSDLFAGDGQLNLLPLVYRHPLTGKETLCFNLQKGYCLGFIEELPSMGAIFDGLEAFLDQESAGSAYQRALRPLLGVGEGAPSKFEILAPGPTLKKIRQAIDGLSGASRRRAIWRQRWEDGDFALVDNMALANLPRPVYKGAASPAFLLHRTATVDFPEVEIRNARGAKAVVLKGDGRSLRDAFDDRSEYRYVLSAMLRVAPLDQGATGVEARSSQAVPPREEAVRALQEGGFPLGLLDQIDLQVQEARANGEDALATTLKKCMIQMHPDRNPGREEVVPIFKYLRRLRVEQNLFKRGRMEESSKKSVLSKLRKKQRRVSAEP